MKRMTFQQAIKDVEQKREKAVTECVIMIEADSKILCPVRTGTLKRSITHEVKTDKKKTKGAVGTNVEYAYWVERKSPYLEPAVDKNRIRIKEKIREVMDS